MGDWSSESKWKACPRGALVRAAPAERRRWGAERAVSWPVLGLLVASLALGSWALWSVRPAPKPAPAPVARLTCQEAIQMLGAYREGRLSPELQRALQQHFADCPGCARKWRELARRQIDNR